MAYHRNRWDVPARGAETGTSTPGKRYWNFVLFTFIVISRKKMIFLEPYYGFYLYYYLPTGLILEMNCKIDSANAV